MSGLTGGCLCGRVRYRVNAAPTAVVHCHCRTCRRASGAAFVTWATFPAIAFAFTHGTPAAMRATRQAERTFCRDCGTPLTFRPTAAPEEIDVTVGSLDDPHAATPAAHVWFASHVAWLDLDDGLPRFAGARTAGPSGAVP